MNLVDQFFEKLNQLPMLPKVVQEALQLMQQDDIDSSVLASCIGRDAMLSLRVLRMANSAHFGNRGVKSITEAVSLIGLQNLKSLVVAAGVTATFNDIPGLDLNRFWKHSLITAVLARAIAKEAKLSGETAYIAGLMHSVGQIPLYMVFPMAAKNVDEACRGRSVLERHQVEQAVMGIDHCQVGEILAKKWNFAEEIQYAIRHYAEPAQQVSSALLPVVYAAVHIAYALAQEKNADDIAQSLDSQVLAALGWTDVAATTEKIEGFKPLVNEAEQYV